MESICKIEINNVPEDVKLIDSLLSSSLSRAISKYPDAKVSKIILEVHLGKLNIIETDEVKT